VAEHTEYEPGRMFADTQLSGPFARWYHRHWMLDDGAGGTILRDEVDYEPPLGALGRWLTGAFLRKKLSTMFDYRHEVTRRAFEAAGSPGNET
jgi:ligand-binding SRPBCC domain-containing protein